MTPHPVLRRQVCFRRSTVRFGMQPNRRPKFGDRRSYQMDPANSDEAIREVAMDVEEGADMIMVKPALPYLDVIWRVRNTFDLPLAAYNVSGEFAMIKAAAQNGWIDGDRCMMEALTSIKRAGADLIISYHALEAVRILQGDSPGFEEKVNGFQLRLVAWEMTRACNLACVHCRAGACPDPDPDELSLRRGSSSDRRNCQGRQAHPHHDRRRASAAA